MYVFGLAHDSPPANPIIGLITIHNALFIRGANRLDPLWTWSLGPWPSPTPGPAQMYYNMDLISQESNTSVGPTSGPLVIPPLKCSSGPLVWPLDPIWPFSVVAFLLDLRSREFFLLILYGISILIGPWIWKSTVHWNWFQPSGWPHTVLAHDSGLHQPGDQGHFTIC